MNTYVAFIPLRHHPEVSAMLIELKWDKSAETALAQIRERRYPDALVDWQGDLLLVGISYDRHTCRHECIIERLGG